MTAPEDAVRWARRVVGLYGDPDVTWSIVLGVDLSRPVEAGEVRTRLADLVRGHGHLGAVPELVRFSGSDGGVDRARVLDAFANDDYGDADPLLRCALSDDGHRLVVAAHHGAVDGLGLLGAASAVSGVSLGSTARGVPADAEPASFVRGSLARLWEALVHPPARLVSSPRVARGDHLRATKVTVERPGSAALVLAATRTVRAWNAGTSVRSRRVVVALGLSRRRGSPPPPPDRDTAYSRVVADDAHTLDAIARLVAHTPPEPAFPVSDGGGLGPRVARLLSSRLGSTVLVSNLGRVEAEGVDRIDFWPVPTGPSGWCLGLASTSSTTTLTVRARRAWFDEEQVGRLIEVATNGLVGTAS